MELVFKKYFFIIILLSIGGASFLLSQIVATFIGSQLSMGAPASKFKPSRQAVSKEVKDINSGVIFPGTKDLAPVESVETETASIASNADIDWTVEPTESSLPVKVTGTLRHADPLWSLATIQHKSDTHLYKLGSEIENQKIVAISDKRVYFANNGKLEYSAVTKGKKKKKKSSSRSSRGKDDDKPKKKNKVAEGVKKVSDNEWELDRTMLNEQLADLNKLGTQARIIPNYKDGKYSGFKLIGIRPNSLYAAIGIRSGDVIKQISGEEITSPNQALALYEKLRTAENINLEIERRGKKRTHSYNVK